MFIQTIDNPNRVTRLHSVLKDGDFLDLFAFIQRKAVLHVVMNVRVCGINNVMRSILSEPVEEIDMRRLHPPNKSYKELQLS